MTSSRAGNPCTGKIHNTFVLRPTTILGPEITQFQTASPDLHPCVSVLLSVFISAKVFGCGLVTLCFNLPIPEICWILS